MEFFPFHLHGDGERLRGGGGGRREERRGEERTRHRRGEEERKRKRRGEREGGEEAADGERRIHFRLLPDGIVPSARGWRDETGRKRRGESASERGGEEEDVVVGRCENAKRTHPSGRQD